MEEDTIKENNSEHIKIIGLDLHTKIMYSLFNFFAPISAVFVIICRLEAYNPMSVIYGLLSILFGLFLLIHNIKQNNKFLCVDKKSITICKGNIKNPKILNIIKFENLSSCEINLGLKIKYENKNIKLLNTSFSKIGSLFYLGPLVFIPIFKNINIARHKLFELQEIAPDLPIKPTNKPSKTEDIIINFFCWCFVLFVSFIGFCAILSAPLYPFFPTN